MFVPSLSYGLALRIVWVNRKLTRGWGLVCADCAPVRSTKALSVVLDLNYITSSSTNYVAQSPRRLWSLVVVGGLDDIPR